MRGKHTKRLREFKGIVGLITIVAVIIISVLAILVVTFCVGGAVSAFVGMVCWNISMPAIFGFSEITLREAFILFFTIGFLRSNYLSDIKSMYIENKTEEKVTNIALVIFLIIIEIGFALIAVGLTMYSWNNILPQILKVDLIQINFWQAFGFACLFNMFFRFPKLYEEKSKKDKEEPKCCYIEPETTDDIEETSEEEVEATEETTK